ncbi:uncharacterized protein [Sagmatias obliquidens]|uniref:Uncharacterized protein LOC117308271 n=1 Tax=Tursiops truncatus TaxID=9739 RepID=A0A6J3Q351_TURTR|nr:uncharacterized protein LOC113609623 isoform X2 [Lagenorhynchus obliquidens]XP_030694899.1 uncharacterized protein LOC115843202 isoform X2 [Globicephala melas]XP_033696682.1 uncharacterized protein LOC117308271 [Tursiops truncatus]
MNFWSCRAVTEAVREDVRAWKHGVGGTAASEGQVGARVKGGASHLNQTMSPKEMTERREASWSLPSGGLALGRVKALRELPGNRVCTKFYPNMISKSCKNFGSKLALGTTCSPGFQTTGRKADMKAPERQCTCSGATHCKAEQPGARWSQRGSDSGGLTLNCLPRRWTIFPT